MVNFQHNLPSFHIWMFNMEYFFKPKQALAIKGQADDVRHPVYDAQKILTAEARTVEIQDGTQRRAVGANRKGLPGIVCQKRLQGFHIPFLSLTQRLSPRLAPGKILPALTQGRISRVLEPGIASLAALPFPQTLIRPDGQTVLLRRQRNGIQTAAVGAAIKGINGDIPQHPGNLRGGGGRFTDSEVQAYKQDVKNIMIRMGLLSGEEVHTVQQKNVTRAEYLEAETDGLWYPVFSAGDTFAGGAVLGTVRDIWGNLLLEYRADYPGIILYQTVSLGVKAGDPLIAYGEYVDR